MRDREMDQLERRHPGLAKRVTEWHEAHPGGTLEDAVRDLGLWRNPRDRDAQWLVWRHLPEDRRRIETPGGASTHPLRDRIATTVRERIADGTYPPGSRLPSMHLLAGEHRCSVQPVAHVYALLRQEGLISSGSRHGGYWVGDAEARR
jgi:GntR family transcriptional regulator